MSVIRGGEQTVNFSAAATGVKPCVRIYDPLWIGTASRCLKMALGKWTAFTILAVRAWLGNGMVALYSLLWACGCFIVSEEALVQCFMHIHPIKWQSYVTSGGEQEVSVSSLRKAVNVTIVVPRYTLGFMVGAVVKDTYLAGACNSTYDAEILYTVELQFPTISELRPPQTKNYFPAVRMHQNWVFNFLALLDFVSRATVMAQASVVRP